MKCKRANQGEKKEDEEETDEEEKRRRRRSGEDKAHRREWHRERNSNIERQRNERERERVCVLRRALRLDIGIRIAAVLFPSDCSAMH
jgi:hypothetical protein